MFQGLRTIIYPVTDLARARAWYSAVLGFEPYFDQPFYVGFSVGGFELGLDPNAQSAGGKHGGPITYWGVPDVEAALTRMQALGASEGSPCQDVGDGIMVGTVIDPFGNIVGVINNPHFSPDNVR